MASTATTNATNGTADETRLRPAGNARTYFEDYYLSDSILRLNIPVVYEWSAGGEARRGRMTRERATHMIDTVLTSFQHAPEGTFTANPDTPQFYPKADEWVDRVVTGYLSQHTAQSIAEPVPTHEPKEYIFPEELKDKLVDVHTTGGGHYFRYVQSANATQTGENINNDEMVSKTLTGEHTCKQLGMACDNMGSSFNETTGEMVLHVTPKIQLCNESTGVLPEELQESYLAHMSDFLNSDDPKVAREMGLAQYLHGGVLTTRLEEMSQTAGDVWLDSLDRTCTQLIHAGDGPADPFTIESKHIDKAGEMGEDPLKGVHLVLDDMDCSPNVPSQAKETIRAYITSTFNKISEGKPEDRTDVQWAINLADSASVTKDLMASQSEAELARYRQ